MERPTWPTIPYVFGFWRPAASMSWVPRRPSNAWCWTWDFPWPLWRSGGGLMDLGSHRKYRAKECQSGHCHSSRRVGFESNLLTAVWKKAFQEELHRCKCFSNSGAVRIEILVPTTGCYRKLNAQCRLSSGTANIVEPYPFNPIGQWLMLLRQALFGRFEWGSTADLFCLPDVPLSTNLFGLPFVKVIPKSGYMTVDTPLWTNRCHIFLPFAV